MQENLYVNIGGKIKRLAFWTFIVEAIGAIISGIGLMFGYQGHPYAILGGLATIFFGPIVAWVSSWLLYGFGQLIENSDKIAENTRSKAVEEPTPAQPQGTVSAASAPASSAAHTTSPSVIPTEESPEEVYARAKAAIDDGSCVEAYEAAIAELETIPDWKDSQELIMECRRRKEVLQLEEKKEKRNALCLCIILVFIVAAICIVYFINRAV